MCIDLETVDRTRLVNMRCLTSNTYKPRDDDSSGKLVSQEMMKLSLGVSSLRPSSLSNQVMT